MLLRQSANPIPLCSLALAGVLQEAMRFFTYIFNAFMSSCAHAYKEAIRKRTHVSKSCLWKIHFSL